MEVLQTSALPLGDGAGRNQLCEGVPAAASGAATTAESGDRRHRSCASHFSGVCSGPRWPANRRSLSCQASEGWSGKRDSNPRLRPWQGRTLPLSYSRSPRSPHRTTAARGRQPRATPRRHCIRVPAVRYSSMQPQRIVPGGCMEPTSSLPKDHPPDGRPSIPALVIRFLITVAKRWAAPGAVPKITAV